jgi:hypothetical protein
MFLLQERGRKKYATSIQPNSPTQHGGYEKKKEGSGGLGVGTRNSHSPKAGRIFKE